MPTILPLILSPHFAERIAWHLSAQGSGSYRVLSVGPTHMRGMDVFQCVTVKRDNPNAAPYTITL